MIWYYGIAFIISYVLTLLYVFVWNKHYDINISAIFMLIPINNLGNIFQILADTPREMTVALKVVYVGSIFLPYFITMCVFNMCDIKINKWIKVGAFSVNAFIYLTILTMGYYPLYYKSLSLEWVDGHQEIIKEYGPMHALFYPMLISYFLVGIIAIIYCLKKNRQVSKKTILLLVLPECMSIAGFFGNILIGRRIEVIPYVYIFAEIMYLFIAHKMSLYNVSDMVVESMVQTGDTGFISIDYNHRYLGSNKTAKMIMPILDTLAIDQSIDDVPELTKNVNHWLKHFADDDTASKNLYIKRDPENEDNDRMYQVSIAYLYDGKKKRGYQIFLADDTQNQKYISLMDKYNTELEAEVESKTQHIVEMHNNLILGMATMVESRDNSTGGHIRRTSMGVRFLIEEIRRQGTIELSDEFCNNLIKAAPMHDIGKIAVDDAILRKPGRFTDEEFEIMKTHAPEGAKIIHEILKDTDDESFKVIAENVAHYHHERWDGSGYPDRISGEQIPLEARIMAIADVYDALVSKRVYKERMSFEEADRIILEGMGTQFDARLQIYYEAARPRLEAYYKSLEDSY